MAGERRLLTSHFSAQSLITKYTTPSHPTSRRASSTDETKTQAHVVVVCHQEARQGQNESDRASRQTRPTQRTSRGKEGEAQEGQAHVGLTADATETLECVFASQTGAKTVGLMRVRSVVCVLCVVVIALLYSVAPSYPGRICARFIDCSPPNLIQDELGEDSSWIAGIICDTPNVDSARPWSALMVPRAMAAEHDTWAWSQTVTGDQEGHSEACPLRDSKMYN